MMNWLQKFLQPASQPGNKTTVPARRAPSPLTQTARAPEKLPSASVIYGIAAGALFAIAICFLVAGAWFTGLLVLLPAVCFLGFSLHFLKNG
jgi:hypothetical protein